MKFLQEMRQRQVFQLAGLYIVGAWVFIEVASVFFPAWGIPDRSLRYLFIAAAVLFPVVVLFGWFFDVQRDGLFRTIKGGSSEVEAIPLRRQDYAALSMLTAVSAAVLLVTLAQVWNSIGAVEGADALDVLRQPNSIAVLPFNNLDAQRDTEYFSDGITEEILHRLSTLRQLHVLASTSSFAFRRSEDSSAEISAKLGVEYLLHGSVRRDADLVRVTARLLNQTGEQVWSQSFDRKLEAIFAIQSEIAAQVASQIIQEMTGTGGTRPSTSNPEAYDEYLLGKSYTRARSVGWQEKAEAAFRRSIAIDPDFAPAYAGLAYSLFVMRGPRFLEEAMKTAQQAVRLDAGLAEAQAILGVITMSSGDPIANAPEAEQILRRALELDPSYPETYNWLSIALSYLDREDEALGVMEQGYAIDPLSSSLAVNLSNHYAREGEFARAERMQLRLTQLPEPPELVSWSLWNLYMDWSRFGEALRWSHEFWQAQAISYAALGMAERANAILTEHAAQDPQAWLIPGMYILEMQGRQKEALEHMQRRLESEGESLSTLPPDALGHAIVLFVAAGHYEEPLRVYEERGEGDLGTFGLNMEARPFFAAAASIAFAYLQTDQVGAADRIVDRLLQGNDYLVRRPPAPKPLAYIAMLRSMSGDTGGAYEALSQAVDLGWAEYYVAINDPRWGNTLNHPRFDALLERVRANLADQRAEVEEQNRGTL